MHRGSFSSSVAFTTRRMKSAAIALVSAAKASAVYLRRVKITLRMSCAYAEIRNFALLNASMSLAMSCSDRLSVSG